MFTKGKNILLASPRPGVNPLEYEATCGKCGARLARRASFGKIQRDIIACIDRGRLNEVKGPIPSRFHVPTGKG